jgi:predicted DNA-binding protein
MGKYKENPKYNVVSMRLNDEEKVVLEELMRKCNKSITHLMREAIELYTPHLEMRSVQR